MQSDGNYSFLGDVVSDCFNKMYWDEDNILDQIYMCSYYYYDDFNHLLHYRKMHTNITKTLKSNFISSML